MRKIIAIALAVSMLVTFAGCNDNSNNQQPKVVETIDVPKNDQAESDDDVGEHKDYDKENTKCYYSGSLLFAKQDGKYRSMELFTMDIGEGCLEFYANEINKIKEEAGNKVNVYSMIIPSACEFYCPPKYQTEIDDQTDIIQSTYDMLVGVTPIKVLETLKNHNAENIYYRSDSRLAPLGAYYAGKAFAKAAGVDYPDISEYTPSAKMEYIGDLGGMCDETGYADLSKTPDEFIYYKPPVNFKTNYYDEEFKFLTTDKYYQENKDSLYDGYYKGGFYCLRLDTPVENDRKLLIVKDSLGTLLPSFMTSSFSQIYVVSLKYLTANLTEIITEFGVTDVLYMLSTYTITGQSVYTLETLRTQATNGTLKDDAPETDITVYDNYDDTNDTDDTDETSPNEPQYVYDIGLNNQISVIDPPSPPEEEQSQVPTDDYTENYTEDYENYNEDANDDYLE